MCSAGKPNRWCRQGRTCGNKDIPVWLRPYLIAPSWQSANRKSVIHTSIPIDYMDQYGRYPERGRGKGQTILVSTRWSLKISWAMANGPRPMTDQRHHFCLLNMLYFNETDSAVESEQISIILWKNFVISFQEDATRDVFNTLQKRSNSITVKYARR